MRTIPGSIFLVCLLVVHTPAQAQVATDGSTFYSLGDKSTYQTGCFGPCDCAIQGPIPMYGRFLLTFQSFDPLFTNYALSQIDWRVTESTQVIRLTGSGTYRIGGEFALQHQLTLDLSTNGGPSQHFDSGLVPISTSFPAIDIRVSMNNQTQCHDTILDIHAHPVSVIYRLGRKSTYQQGCFAPCLCPMLEKEPVTGTFQLHPKGSDGLFNHYAVTDVNWKVAVLNRHLTGSGTYRVGGEFAAQHQLTLDLSTDGAAPEHFDSGLVSGGTAFPAIDIKISIHGEYCFDTVIVVQARPAGDFDLDGDVDGTDLGFFHSCGTRAGVMQLAAACQAADLSGDGAVDQSDFGLLQRCMSHDGATINPACAQ